MLSVQDFTKILYDAAKPMFVMGGIVILGFMLLFLISPSSSVVSEKDALRNTTPLSPQAQLSVNKEMIQVGDTICLSLSNNNQKYIRIE